MEASERLESRADRLRFDVLLAAALFAGETLLWVLGPRQNWPASWPLALGWLAASYVGLALRRVALWWAVAILAVHTTVSALIPVPTAGIPLVVVTFSVAAALPLRGAALATTTLWLPAMVIAVVAGNTREPPLQLEPGFFLLFNTMAMLVCFFIGRTVHNRRAYVAALEDRAHSVESRQRALTEQAVAEERRRIARELHDVVAHHVSVMSVLATGSRRALLRDPAAADEALATIEETGRAALRDMRRLLRVLRTDAEPAGELEPQPGLPGLETLLEQVREAGLPVSLSVSGEPRPLDPGIDLAAYRVTQEALTNALKHAGPASADVTLTFAPKELTIDICDTGRGPRPGGDRLGHGLLGMRERISLYGGSLRTGPRPGGGFRVTAHLPLEQNGSAGVALPQPGPERVA